MPKLTRRCVILAKQETTYGQDAGPDGSNGLLVEMTPEVSPEGDKIERNFVRDTLSPIGHVIGTKQVPLNLSVEAKGGGIDGTLQPPEFEPLLMACATQKTETVNLPVDSTTGFIVGETVTGADSGATGVIHWIESTALHVKSVTGTFQNGEVVSGGDSSATATIQSAPFSQIEYRPLSDPDQMASTSVYYYKDGILHKVAGCRGTWSLDISVGQIPKFSFNLTGLYADPSDATMPTPQTSDLTPPVVLGIGLNIGNYTPVATALSVSVGNNIAQRKDARAEEGMRELIINGRNPSGSIDPEADKVANFDPWSAWKNATPAQIKATVGKDAGNKFTVVIPKALYESVKYNDREGIVTYDLPFICKLDSVGDDEIRLIFS